MSKISRSDVFTRSEGGGEWLEEFVQLCAKDKNLQEDILNAILNKHSETVDSVVQNYRQMVGLDLIKDASEKISTKTNDMGGLDYIKDEDKETAKKFDLITLPSKIEGTNCSNCKFIKITDKENGLGFCNHKDIQLPVTSRMCCALWAAEGQKNSWEDKPISIRQASTLGPISPMKLRKLKNPDDLLQKYDDSELIVQVKYDGFKTQAIRNDAGTVKLYTRRGEDFTSNLPDLISQLEDTMPKGSFFLGELVWEKDGKQSISDIQTVVGSAPEKAQEKLKERGGKAIFYVYDLLWDGGKDLTKQSYSERYDKLKKALGKNKENVKLVPNYTYSEKDEVINKALEVNAEGIVLKPKKSAYEYGKKGTTEPVGEWAKFKPGAKAHTDEVVLNKYSKGENKLIFPMYQYKGSDLFEVGKLSGMSKEDESKIKKNIDDGKSIVVEITFQERMPSGKFRHAGWSRFRPDKPAKEVKYSKAHTILLSIRQAKINILNDPKIMKFIDSFCMFSGGTKSTHSIINSLRNKFGNELISFSDEELIDYINNRKQHFKDHHSSDLDDSEIGKAGLNPHDHYEDQVADYIQHGK